MRKHNFPLFSIIIPTYNSQATLELTLQSVKKQTYPQNKIEILVIDGGSTDATYKIAKKYKCRIIKNSKVLQVYAKHIGYLRSKGKYIMHLDSDEVLENNNSLKLKYQTFKKNKNVRAVLASGYKTPPGYSQANYLVTEYGDAFSYFLYHNSTTYGFFEKDLRKYGRTVYEDKNCLLVDQVGGGLLPLVELSVMSFTVDRKYLVRNFPELEKKSFLISHVYYMIIKKGGLIGFIKNDPVFHYSILSFRKYFKKIRSRVINNVYKTDMGMSAFSGRDRYYPKWFNYKKYLFLPYSLSLIAPLVDGIYLTYARKRLVFILHPLLCLQIVILITYYYFLKLIRIETKIKAWGT